MGAVKNIRNAAVKIQTADMDIKNKILENLCKSGDDKLIAAKIIDKFNLAQKGKRPTATHFLTPAQQLLVERFLPLLGSIEHKFLGGAEDGRRILCFYSEYFDSPLENEFLRAIFIKCPSKPEHRDCLGSLIGLGIKREFLGDIIITDNGCFVAVLLEIAPFIKSELKRIGRVGVLSVEILPITAMTFGENELTEKYATVSSLRLDAVISAGFNISRSKSAQYVQSKKVSVNYVECVKPDFFVKSGDRISVMGLGRIIVETDGRLTKRGRIALTVKK